MAGRCIVVGDEKQSLYGFRGADCNAFERIAEMLQSNGRPFSRCELPLNYRCDDMIIQHARQWVPGLKGHSKARGTVDELSFGEAMERANNDGTDIALPDGVDSAPRSLPVDPSKPVSFAFLCRINVPLVVTAYQLIAQGKRVCIIGRSQIGAPLKKLIVDLCGEKDDDNYTNRITDRIGEDGRVIEEGLMSRLVNYYDVQSRKLQNEKYESKLEQLQQNVECIEIIATRVKDDKVTSVLTEIDNLFKDDPDPGVISLSTIHRAKGLEWDVVFILRPDLLPHPAAQPNADGSWSDEQQQEENAQYVAATRPRNRLYYISNWPFGRQGNNLPYERPVSEYEKDVLGNLQDRQGMDLDAEREVMMLESTACEPPKSQPKNKKQEPEQRRFPVDTQTFNDGKPF